MANVRVPCIWRVLTYGLMRSEVRDNKPVNLQIMPTSFTSDGGTGMCEIRYFPESGQLSDGQRDVPFHRLSDLVHMLWTYGMTNEWLLLTSYGPLLERHVRGTNVKPCTPQR